MACNWTNSVGKHDEALTILKAGLEANPSSFLLTFAYAEALEIKKDFAEVHNVYEKFLAVLVTDLKNLEQTTNAAQDATNGSGSQNPNTSGNGANNSGEMGTQSQSQNSYITPVEEPKKKTDLQRHRTEYGLAWIMYMRFAMRAEGVRRSRTVFAKARKDPWTPWEVFEAAGTFAQFLILLTVSLTELSDF